MRIKYLLSLLLLAFSVATVKGASGTGAGDPTKPSHIVISKESMTLKLYDVNGKIIYDFPVAMGKNLGNKQCPGDKKTPEGSFVVQQIQPATTWSHDFGDGKGVIPHAYGDWFIRLLTPPHRGIGIHGTHDPSSIGKRVTEGCIRLHNENLNKLKKLVYVGMTVIIETSKKDQEVDNPTQPKENVQEETLVKILEPMAPKTGHAPSKK